MLPKSMDKLFLEENLFTEYEMQLSQKAISVV